MLLGTIEPELDNGAFLAAMGVLGIRDGPGHLSARQRGPVLDRRRGPQRGRRPPEHRPAARLLARHRASRSGRDHGADNRLSANVGSDERIPEDVTQEVQVRSSGGSFTSLGRGRRAAEAGLDDETTDALVENYEDAQLQALKIAFLFAALIVLASFWTARNLPARRFEELAAGAAPPAAEPASACAAWTPPPHSFSSSRWP